MEAPYKPINCSYYDRLEAWATQGDICQIIWSDQDGNKHQTESKIKDLQLKDGVEYLIAENHLSIRLDLLVSVNGFRVPGAHCTL